MISNRPSNKMNMKAAHYFLQYGIQFFSQINFDFAAIRFYYHHILCIVMAFDTRYLGVCLSIRNSVSLDRKALVGYSRLSSALVSFPGKFIRILGI